ncbi:MULTISPECIES: hypothetical protein [unclassified Streptomyces]
MDDDMDATEDLLSIARLDDVPEGPYGDGIRAAVTEALRTAGL